VRRKIVIIIIIIMISGTIIFIFIVFLELKQLKLRMIGDCGGSLSDFSVSRAFCNLPCLEFLLLRHHNVSHFLITYIYFLYNVVF